MKINTYQDIHLSEGNYPKHSSQRFENLISTPPILELNAEDFSNLLTDLQGNIIRHHNKNFSRYYFIHFKENKGNIEKALNWIRHIAESITTAKSQLRATDQPDDEKNKAPVLGFYLSWKGYERLGLEHLAPPEGNNGAFEKGMAQRIAFDSNIPDDRLHPKSKVDWETKHLDIHAMLMIASDDPDFSDVTFSQHFRGLDDAIQQISEQGWGSTTMQNGLMKRAVFGKGEEATTSAVEWFGFRDGISQPFFFPDKQTVGHFSEDDLSTLRIVLTKDKGGIHWYSAGSFLAFIKLEQDVQVFNTNVEKVTSVISEKDKQLAAAYIMGRFKDGTPVTLSPRPLGNAGKAVQSDFSYSKNYFSDGEFYASDKTGTRCPFASHTRKANPRDGQDTRFLVRRGVLYDDRKSKFDKSDTQFNEAETPAKDVGMLFLSFQASLEQQFEYILKNWLHSVNTGKQATGVDLATGIGREYDLSRWYIPRTWGTADENDKALITTEEIDPCVRFKGGEYFFAPSISFLKKAKDNSLILNLFKRKPEPEERGAGEEIVVSGRYKMPVIIRKK